MKKTGILNRHLAAATARLGHTDEIVVADAGLPIPDGPLVVDLSIVAGTPRFMTVLDVLMEELVIEHATAATEVYSDNPETAGRLEELFPEGALSDLPHEEFKERTADARVLVRTGENTPYSNVILRCGVAF